MAQDQLSDEAFESEECRQFLEGIRPNLICPTMLLSNTDRANDDSQSALLLEEGDTDEELIMRRFRDYLLTAHNEPGVITTPLPGVVLYEYLNAFGPQEPTFWRELPTAKLFRVTDGTLSISPWLSDQLSRVFGTRSRFWSDIQAEYDRLKSGAK